MEDRELPPTAMRGSHPRSGSPRSSQALADISIVTSRETPPKPEPTQLNNSQIPDPQEVSDSKYLF